MCRPAGQEQWWSAPHLRLAPQHCFRSAAGLQPRSGRVDPEQAAPEPQPRSLGTLLRSRGTRSVSSRGTAPGLVLSAHSGSCELTLFLNDVTFPVLLLLSPKPESRHQPLIVKSPRGAVKEKLSGTAVRENSRLHQGAGTPSLASRDGRRGQMWRGLGGRAMPRKSWREGTLEHPVRA